MSPQESLDAIAEWVVTHPPEISPELVGSKLADAEAIIDPLIKGEQRTMALQEKGAARRWLIAEALKRGFPGIKSDLEGKRIRLVDFPNQEFYLTYAGWGDEWIVKNMQGQDMMRVTGTEAKPYLAEVPGWEQRIQYQLGQRAPGAITASQEEYERPMPYEKQRYIDAIIAANPVYTKGSAFSQNVARRLQTLSEDTLLFLYQIATK
jgi:hypothetical protein